MKIVSFISVVPGLIRAGCGIKGAGGNTGASRREWIEEASYEFQVHVREAFVWCAAHERRRNY
jgi:hypothetical protein